MDKEYDSIIKKLYDLRTKVYLIEKSGNQEKQQEELNELKKEIGKVRRELARYKTNNLNNEERKEGR